MLFKPILHLPITSLISNVCSLLKVITVTVYSHKRQMVMSSFIELQSCLHFTGRLQVLCPPSPQSPERNGWGSFPSWIVIQWWVQLTEK